jgi:hypothetical protein
MKFLMLKWSEHDASGGNEGDIAAWPEFDQAAQDAGVRFDGRRSSLPGPRPPWSRPRSQVVEVVDAAAAGPFTSGGAQIEAYLLDCRDVAGAQDWARRLPTCGRVEVRPLLEYDSADSSRSSPYAGQSDVVAT